MASREKPQRCTRPYWGSAIERPFADGQPREALAVHSALLGDLLLRGRSPMANREKPQRFTGSYWGACC